VQAGHIGWGDGGLAPSKTRSMVVSASLSQPQSMARREVPATARGIERSRRVGLSCDGGGLLRAGVEHTLRRSMIDLDTWNRPEDAATFDAGLVVTYNLAAIAARIDRLELWRFDLPVIAVLPQQHAIRSIRSLTSSFRGVIALESAERTLAAAIDAVAAGCSVTSITPPTAQPGREQPRVLDPDLTQDELSILSRLAHGMTIHHLAEMEGYSERTMHRKLIPIYRKLAASSRVQAVTAAASLGLLDDVDPDDLQRRS
jgi:DNA-binding NarL/FixJ family response regulator